MIRTTEDTTRDDRYTAVSISPKELNRRKEADRPVWEMVIEIMKDVPQEEIDKLPFNASEEHDHYIYGTPKKNS